MLKIVFGLVRVFNHQNVAIFRKIGVELEFLRAT